MKKFISLLLALIMLFALTACKPEEEVKVPETKSPEVVKTTVPEVKPSETSQKESEPEEETRIITGENGEQFEIPKEVTRVARPIGAFAQMTAMLTEGNGKIVAAVTGAISDYFKQVFPDYLESNPNNYNSTSIEDLIASGAQVCYGPGSRFSDEQIGQLKAAGIVHVPINNIRDVAGMSSAFTIIGNILGEKEAARAKEFVEYYQGNIEKCKDRTKDIAEADRVKMISLFYSADSFTTINKNDISQEYIEAAGGINVAADYTAAGESGLIVDEEQIVSWNPEFIMVSNQAGKEVIENNPALATVDAVANGKVEVCPFGIYLWSVRSGEGAILPFWLSTNLYPELFSDIDMRDVVKDFFNYWYNYDIPEEEITNTLAGRP